MTNVGNVKLDDIYGDDVWETRFKLYSYVEESISIEQLYQIFKQRYDEENKSV